MNFHKKTRKNSFEAQYLSFKSKKIEKLLHGNKLKVLKLLQ